MRPHQTPNSFQPSTSSRCVACSKGHVAYSETAAPPMLPNARAGGHGTGSKARIPMTKAPPSAIAVTVSMPWTQPSVTVERAMVNVRRMTSSADQTSPRATDPRARSSKIVGLRSSGPLGDADCIPRPHQPGKVIASPHHIKIDVLAQVKAWIEVRPPKAGDVEIEHDHGRAPATNGLEQANPFGVRARCDHRDRTAWQPPDPVPREGLGQRRPSISLGHRQVVEDQAVLAHRPVWLEDRAP